MGDGSGQEEQYQAANSSRQGGRLQPTPPPEATDAGRAHGQTQTPQDRGLLGTGAAERRDLPGGQPGPPDAGPMTQRGPRNLRIDFSAELASVASLPRGPGRGPGPGPSASARNWTLTGASAYPLQAAAPSKISSWTARGYHHQAGEERGQSAEPQSDDPSEGRQDGPPPRDAPIARRRPLSVERERVLPPGGDLRALLSRGTSGSGRGAHPPGFAQADEDDGPPSLPAKRAPLYLNDPPMRGAPPKRHKRASE